TPADPPVIEVVAPAPQEPAATEPVATAVSASEPQPATPIITAPLGLGDQPGQQTTLGMSPLKRALAKLRETVQQEQAERPADQ
ncbi:MAG TPA: hypothetical protein VK157_17555, partial [Phycisphaerales bacterium]|nr:hypothetical protein [Phycisphaerales bacterium]